MILSLNGLLHATGSRSQILTWVRLTHLVASRRFAMKITIGQIVLAADRGTLTHVVGARLVSAIASGKHGVGQIFLVAKCIRDA